MKENKFCKYKTVIKLDPIVKPDSECSVAINVLTEAVHMLTVIIRNFAIGLIKTNITKRKDCYYITFLYNSYKQLDITTVLNNMLTNSSLKDNILKHSTTKINDQSKTEQSSSKKIIDVFNLIYGIKE